MRDRFFQLLNSPRGPLLLGALSLVLSAPTLGFGLQTDDHALSVNARLGTHPFSLFYAWPEDIALMRRTGSLAWWTSPELQIHLVRPLASLTHYLDFRLWPDSPWVMHLANCLLYALVVFVAARLYRRFLPDDGGGRADASSAASMAGLAGLMFTIDEGHAPSIGWISARNTLLATLFALLALLTHMRGQQERRPQLHALSALCVALALLSGEPGVEALAYLLAYAWVFDSRSWSLRARSLLPQLSVFVIWAIGYVAVGGGVRGTSWYRDLSDPLGLLREGVLNLPLLLASMVGPSLISVVALAPAAAARLGALLIALPLLSGLALATPRNQQNRFFLLCALLCLPALFTTIPQDRLLLAASFGGFGLLASFLEAAKGSASRWLRGLRHGMVGVHLWLAPLLFVPSLNMNSGLERGTRAILAVLPKAMPRQVILINTPLELLALYPMMVLRGQPGGPVPESLSQLYSGASSLVAERIDQNTLQLTAADGWGRIPFERIFCSVHDMPAAGSEIDLPGLHVSVLETNSAGMPYRVQFRFPGSLEADERAFYAWRGQAPQPWQPPALGQRVSVPAIDMMKSF